MNHMKKLTMVGLTVAPQLSTVTSASSLVNVYADTESSSIDRQNEAIIAENAKVETAYLNELAAVREENNKRNAAYDEAVEKNKEALTEYHEELERVVEHNKDEQERADKLNQSIKEENERITARNTQSDKQYDQSVAQIEAENARLREEYTKRVQEFEEAKRDAETVRTRNYEVPADIKLKADQSGVTLRVTNENVDLTNNPDAATALTNKDREMEDHYRAVKQSLDQLAIRQNRSDTARKELEAKYARVVEEYKTLYPNAPTEGVMTEKPEEYIKQLESLIQDAKHHTDHHDKRNQFNEAIVNYNKELETLSNEYKNTLTAKLNEPINEPGGEEMKTDPKSTLIVVVTPTTANKPLNFEEVGTINHLDDLYEGKKEELKKVSDAAEEAIRKRLEVARERYEIKQTQGNAIAGGNPFVEVDGSRRPYGEIKRANEAKITAYNEAVVNTPDTPKPTLEIPVYNETINLTYEKIPTIADIANHDAAIAIKSLPPVVKSTESIDVKTATVSFKGKALTTKPKEPVFLTAPVRTPHKELKPLVEPNLLEVPKKPELTEPKTPVLLKEPVKPDLKPTLSKANGKVDTSSNATYWKEVKTDKDLKDPEEGFTPDVDGKSDIKGHILHSIIKKKDGKTLINYYEKLPEDKPNGSDKPNGTDNSNGSDNSNDSGKPNGSDNSNDSGKPNGSDHSNGSDGRKHTYFKDVKGDHLAKPITGDTFTDAISIKGYVTIGTKQEESVRTHYYEKVNLSPDELKTQADQLFKQLNALNPKLSNDMMKDLSKMTPDELANYIRDLQDAIRKQPPQSNQPSLQGKDPMKMNEDELREYDKALLNYLKPLDKAFDTYGNKDISKMSLDELRHFAKDLLGKLANLEETNSSPILDQLTSETLKNYIHSVLKELKALDPAFNTYGNKDLSNMNVNELKSYAKELEKTLEVLKQTPKRIYQMNEAELKAHIGKLINDIKALDSTFNALDISKMSLDELKNYAKELEAKRNESSKSSKPSADKKDLSKMSAEELMKYRKELLQRIAELERKKEDSASSNESSQQMNLQKELTTRHQKILKMTSHELQEHHKLLTNQITDLKNQLLQVNQLKAHPDKNTLGLSKEDLLSIESEINMRLIIAEKELEMVSSQESVLKEQMDKTRNEKDHDGLLKDLDKAYEDLHNERLAIRKEYDNLTSKNSVNSAIHTATPQKGSSVSRDPRKGKGKLPDTGEQSLVAIASALAGLSGLTIRRKKDDKE